jgi:hypothetical protein
MDYNTRSIRDLLKDIKPYLKESSTLVRDWVILTDENDKEYVDSYYNMSNKFGLYRIPARISKFRATFEAELNKQRVGGVIKKGKEPTHIPYARIQAYIPPQLDEFVLATSFTLDFDPDWGMVCHAKADNGLSKKINLSLLYPFEDIVKEFPEYGEYQLYLKEGHSVVPIWADELIGYVTPIYADKEGNNKA